MNKEIILWHDELNQLNEENNWQNDIDNVKNCFSEDFNEILDSDIKIQEIAQSLSIMEENGDYYGWYKIAKEAIDYWNNLKAFHKSFLYERLGDFTMQLGDYYKTLEYFNESKKYWNRLIYEKILNLYTSWLLIDEWWEFSYENNVDFLLWECKNACEYNMDAYAEYGYYTYLYKQDLETAEKILNEGINKWSKTSLIKYIELHRDIFLLDLGNIENKDKKIEFIELNKEKIEKLYKYAIDLWETKLIWELGAFYEEIAFYSNALEKYQLHIKVNKDYTYYKNLGDLYSSWNLLLFKKEFTDKSKIESYENLYEKAFLNRDVDNYIYWLNKLLEIYVEKRNINKATDYYNILYQFRNWNNFLDLKEKILLLIKKLYENNIEMMDKIFSELIWIDNKYLLLQADFYEWKNNRKALNSLLEAYLISINESLEESIYDSGDALGMFLYFSSLKENILENKKFLEDMAEKAYNYDSLLDIEIQTIKELI